MLKAIPHFLLTIAILLFIWQVTTLILRLPPYILPSPLQVAHVFVTDFAILRHQSIPTLYETFIGLLLGILFGCLSALTVYAFKPARLFLLPLLLVSQALPTFAIAPILVLWFGYGITAKIIVIVIMIFFPVTGGFYDGLRQTPNAYLDQAHIVGASRWRTLALIRIPAALPALAGGIRVAVVYAPMGAVIGEWVGSERGLGYLMQISSARMQIAMMFAALFVIVTLTLLLYFSVDRLLKKFIFWQTTSAK